MAPVALSTSPSLSPKMVAKLSPSPAATVSKTGNSYPALNGQHTSLWRPQFNPNPEPRTEFSYDPLDEALDAYQKGEFVLVMDDESRENEGDLIIDAKMCTTEKMAWMIRYTSGFICIALTPERLEELNIPMMSLEHHDSQRTAYTLTVDVKQGTTTGISAHDRSLTGRSLVSPSTKADDFYRPGHLVPLKAARGGVLERRGHTEASLDLGLLASPSEDPKFRGGILCEIVIDDQWEEPEIEYHTGSTERGSMLRRDGCRAFADRWGLKMINIDMLAKARAAEVHSK